MALNFHWADERDDKLTVFLFSEKIRFSVSCRLHKMSDLFSGEKIRHFIQIVSLGGILYEMSNSIYWGKEEKMLSNVFIMSIEIFTQHAKC